MRYSTTAIVLAAMSIGEAVASPAHGHAHAHRRAHDKRQNVDWADVDYSGVDYANLDVNWSSAYAAGMAEKTDSAAVAASTPAVAVSAAAAVTTPAAVVASASSSESSSNDASGSSDLSSDLSGALSGDLSSSLENMINDVSLLFGGLQGFSNSRTTFGAQADYNSGSEVSYMGEVGNPYGSALIKVDSAEGQDFTAKFVNTQDNGITVNCWLKVGRDGQANSGQALAPKETALTMYLPAGQSQVVAFMNNTEGACTQASSNIAAYGAFATTWFEYSMVSTGSGFDVSAIPNSEGNNYNMTISAVEAPNSISNMHENMWLTATEPVGNSDGSVYISQSTATLTVIMGGTV